MLMRKEKGITLIALIITIIILIILSAVTINSIVGEDSLINMATEALVRTQIAEYQEELDQIGMMTTADNVFNKLTEKEYLEEFKKKVEESEVFKDKKSAEIMEEEGEKAKLRIVTKEGYVFDVTDKERKYVGKIGDTGFEPLPEIKEGSITIKLETDATEEGTWTKGPVHATIEESKELEGLTIQYTKDAKAQKGWTNYTTGEKIEITTNGVIIARVKNNIGDSVKTATKTIDNIDTVAPNNPKDVQATVEEGEEGKKNSIKVTATVQDANPDANHEGELSGIAKVLFSTNGSNWEEEVVTTVGTTSQTVTHIFKNQTGGTHTVQVKAVDKAENESQTVSIENISIDATPPTDPKIEIIEGTQKAGEEGVYTSDVKIKITPGEDTGEGATGIKETTYSVTGQNQTSLSSGTIEGTKTEEITLTEEGTYTIKAQTTDNAGNKSQEVTKQITKKSTTPLKDLVIESNYGDYVNYPVDLDDNANTPDWRIFYKGKNSEGKDRVFIIASDYVPNTKTETARDLSGMNMTNDTYCVYWSQTPKFNERMENLLKIIYGN